jgi:hypothetical protein
MLKPSTQASRWSQAGFIGCALASLWRRSPNRHMPILFSPEPGDRGWGWQFSGGFVVVEPRKLEQRNGCHYAERMHRRYPGRL